MVTIRRHIGKFCFLRYKLYWFKGIQYWCNQCFLFRYRYIRQFCYLQFYSLCYRYYPTPCKVYAQSYCLYSIDSCSKMVSIANPIITDPCGLASVSWRMTGATIRSSSLSGINYLGEQLYYASTTTVVYAIKDVFGNTTVTFFVVRVRLRNPAFCGFAKAEIDHIGENEELALSLSPNPTSRYFILQSKSSTPKVLP